MTFEQLGNFIRDGVSSSVASGDTSLGVSDASIFPDPTDGNYHLVLWDEGSYILPSSDPDVEIIEVTARDTGTNTLTITRGVEGTSAVFHPSSSVVQLAPTSALLRSAPFEVVETADDLPANDALEPTIKQPALYYIRSNDQYVLPYQD